jgi:hypothetical protein
MTIRTSDSCGPDARALKKEIANSTSTIWTTAYYGPDVGVPYKEITCSGRVTVRTMCHPIRTMSLNRKDFSVKFSENLVAQLSVGTAHVLRSDGAQVYFA